MGLYIPSSNAEIDPKLNLIVELVATLNLNDDVDYGIQGAILGRKICKAGGGIYFSTTQTIGERICKARGYSSCCTMMSAKEALSLPVKDTNWKWDKFINPNTYGNVWACRGTATGKFAEDYKCFDELKTDDTWPNN